LYSDLVPAFRRVKIDEVSLEHCTLGYDLMELWKQGDFKGALALGVIGQRSDVLETPEIVRKRLTPALAYFSPDRLLLTSECGFGHVPLQIARSKLRVLAQTCRDLRKL
jgi:5-methyltetrahydropteroyltriglutamate--homocysteine methyltransferase